MTHHKTSSGRNYLVIGAAVATALLASQAAAQVLWSDEFDSGSQPSAADWNIDTGGGGWGNSEIQTYTDDPANVRIENGELIITAIGVAGRGPNVDFSSGRINTQDLMEFKYGTVEARIMMPDLADGLWPAFWTLGANSDTVTWPACGEIDIVEMGNEFAIADGTVNRRVGSTAHWDDNGHAFYGLTYDNPADINGQWRVFRMEWTPTLISTYIDNQWIWSIDISDPASFGGEELHQPHYLILNLAVGGSFTGIFAGRDVSAPTPAEMRVDWVRLYDNGFTELGGGDPPPTGATDMWVDSITTGTQGGGNKKKARATVSVIDDQGSPVSGADVTVTFSGSHNQTLTATTGSNGQVTMTTSVTNGNAAFVACVDNVTHADLSYDAASNTATCGTY